MSLSLPGMKVPESECSWEWKYMGTKVPVYSYWCVCCIRSVDPFTKKDWYDVKAPSMFNTRNIGKTIVTRTIGTSLWSFIYILFVSAVIANFSLCTEPLIVINLY